jgi:hypothetical protein
LKAYVLVRILNVTIFVPLAHSALILVYRVKRASQHGTTRPVQ